MNEHAVPWATITSPSRSFEIVSQWSVLGQVHSSLSQTCQLFFYRSRTLESLQVFFNKKHVGQNVCQKSQYFCIETSESYGTSNQHTLIVAKCQRISQNQQKNMLHTTLFGSQISTKWWKTRTNHRRLVASRGTGVLLLNLANNLVGGLHRWILFVQDVCLQKSCNLKKEKDELTGLLQFQSQLLMLFLWCFLPSRLVFCSLIFNGQCQKVGNLGAKALSEVVAIQETLRDVGSMGKNRQKRQKNIGQPWGKPMKKPQESERFDDFISTLVKNQSWTSKIYQNLWFSTSTVFPNASIKSRWQDNNGFHGPWGLEILDLSENQAQG